MRYTWAPKACAHGEGGSWVTWQLGGQNERQSWNLVTRGHPLEDGWLWRGRPSQTPPPPRRPESPCSTPLGASLVGPRPR